MSERVRLSDLARKAEIYRPRRYAKLAYLPKREDEGMYEVEVSDGVETVYGPAYVGWDENGDEVVMDEDEVIEGYMKRHGGRVERVEE